MWHDSTHVTSTLTFISYDFRVRRQGFRPFTAVCVQQHVTYRGRRWKFHRAHFRADLGVVGFIRVMRCWRHPDFISRRRFQLSLRRLKRWATYVLHVIVGRNINQTFSTLLFARQDPPCVWHVCLKWCSQSSTRIRLKIASLRETRASLLREDNQYAASSRLNSGIGA